MMGSDTIESTYKMFVREEEERTLKRSANTICRHALTRISLPRVPLIRNIAARPVASLLLALVPFALVTVALLSLSPGAAQAAGKDAETTSVKNIDESQLIIPPPLEDLGRDYKIRLIYFVPSDSKVKANYRKKADVLMRVVADIYRREMKSNGLNSRGLDFELDENGKMDIKLVKGARPGVFYRGEPVDTAHMRYSQRQEIWEKTGFTRNRAVLVFSEAGSIAEAAPIPQFHSGFAFVSGDIFRDEITANTIEEQIKGFLDTTPVKKVGGTDKVPRNKAAQVSNGVLIHELGHIFGMLHDSSNPANIMYYGYHSLGKMYHKKTAAERATRFSLPHARIASATRFLSEKINEDDNESPVIHKFELVKQPRVGDKTVRFSLKLSDNEGLSSLVCMQRGGEWNDAMVGDIDFKGSKSYKKTVTFTCPRALGKSQPVTYWINIMDVNGNLGQAQIPFTDVLKK